MEKDSFLFQSGEPWTRNSRPCMNDDDDDETAKRQIDRCPIRFIIVRMPQHAVKLSSYARLIPYSSSNTPRAAVKCSFANT